MSESLSHSIAVL